jgi:diguanylate cyclase (GGDEF)-like protein
METDRQLVTDRARSTDPVEPVPLRPLYDPLTGLPNRDLFVDRLDRAIQRSYRAGEMVAIVFADLDSFKAVNETYGRHVGDELLRAVARRLGRALRAGDTVTRLTGDQFVMLCEDLAGPSVMTAVAARVEACFDGSFVLADVEIEASASVGMAFAGRGGDVAEAVLEEADVALTRMKRTSEVRHAVFDLRDQRATLR